MTVADRTLVLVVEDEPQIRRLLRTSLGANGFAVVEAINGKAAFEAITRERPEVILLDLGLPDMDGLAIIETLRSSGDKTPIVVLSSRGEEATKVEALDLGADDYVTKPFGVAELIARLRTSLRHRVQAEGGEPVFESGDLRIDLVHRRVTRSGSDVKLSPKEYDILRLLALHAGKVLTHKFIMAELWGANADVQYLRIYVRQLRAKIEAHSESPQHIITETGVGYRLK
ncbi:two component transcriptional regulator, winged helix family [Rhodomicrobium vannielii ATCC 17100]|uniref:Two component transcriptional regulator, winged helix family n=1 Tax=Rhodomicrobium vannielii (strain ATCC 17100 / DSM 162 / LMG 4299 / NCIMB 10020 / ATH 3.1.1) TaxID=648757 RepID=E3I287_RHOVT|nr:response regulator [Rhodomicrobium vannielii]ADP72474.1 two component transcriptional regulator, winged helix family [Rhodomicrobium vannielii ATCC 17100]